MEYVQQFDRKKRWHLRADRRKVEDAGYTWRLARLSDVDVGELARLETNLMHRYGHLQLVEADSERGIRSAIRYFHEDALVSETRGEDGSLVGFMVLLAEGDTWHARQAGFDYASQGKTPVYFETVFYGPLDAAADSRVRLITYGTGSERVKTSRGCDTEGQHMFVKYPLIDCADSE